ncbi:hypothetical protein CFC21_060173 [Triticum aestivum]|uniref:Uncharacterized protein n=5 Tax=Triticinae TaxID=1648030 RepID=A0A3B6JDM4_WHEAT|nr:ankyrin-1 [Aegilops tauschii subsp. strangulata]XP_044373152.1 ankyrin-1-like [Triticum aestivum]KAF7052008.1 hypothetical protein CFC21_060173 [Triticum aestivum]
MAKGRRRAVAAGGGRPRGGGSAGAAAASGSKDYISAGVNLMGAHLGMRRMNSEQSEAIKRVIESSDVVDPDRAMRMLDNVNASDSDSSDNEEMEDYGPLHEAAGTGRMDTCKYLVEELGFDINADANNDSGMTPLACAVARGKAIAVRYLLDKGANLNKQDSVGFSPLHYATKKGNDGLVRLLLSKGASADISSCEGTPLHVAVSDGNYGIVQSLLQHDADPNRVFSDLGTPMTAAVLCADVICVAGKISVSAALKCMKLLVKAGAGLNCTTPDTPLVIATSKDLTECVQYLLEVGADANIPSNYNGTTPIEIAADSGKRELVEILFPYTKPIQRVSNWSVDGIITHAKSKHLKDKGKQCDKASKVKQSDKDSKVKRKEDASARKSSSEEKVIQDKKAELKSLGAKAVEEKDYAGASKFYSEAIKVDPKDATLYSNRSLCHLRIGEAHDALVDADACIRLRPDWPKGYCRKGAALTALKDHKEACDAYMAAVKLDPSNQELHEAFWEAVAAMKAELGAGQSGSSSDSD